MEGSCTFGDRCRFRHSIVRMSESRVGAPVKCMGLFAPAADRFCLFQSAMNVVQILDEKMAVVNKIDFPGEVDQIHVGGSVLFVSYMAVLEGVSSVPVGMIRAIDLTNVVPTTELKRGALYSHALAIKAMTSEPIPTDPSAPPVLFSGSNDGTIRMWMRNPSMVWDQRTFGEGHTSGVTSLVSVLQIKRLFSGGMDQTIRIWSLDDATLTATILSPAGHASPVTYGGLLGLQLGGAYCLLSASTDGVIRLWRVAGPDLLEPVQALPPTAAPAADGVVPQLTFCQLCGPGLYLTGFSNGTIEIRNCTTPELGLVSVVRGPGAHENVIITSLVPVPGGPFFFSADNAGTVKAWKMML